MTVIVGEHDLDRRVLRVPGDMDDRIYVAFRCCAEALVENHLVPLCIGQIWVRHVQPPHMRQREIGGIRCGRSSGRRTSAVHLIRVSARTRS